LCPAGERRQRSSCGGSSCGGSSKPQQRRLQQQRAPLRPRGPPEVVYLPVPPLLLPLALVLLLPLLLLLLLVLHGLRRRRRGWGPGGRQQLRPGAGGRASQPAMPCTALLHSSCCSETRPQARAPLPGPGGTPGGAAGGSARPSPPPILPPHTRTSSIILCAISTAFSSPKSMTVVISFCFSSPGLGIFRPARGPAPKALHAPAAAGGRERQRAEGGEPAALAGHSWHHGSSAGP
jgi:hypothetical protein